jgi:hypothetical protein
MSTNRSKDRSSLCSFMYVDGRHCRIPRRVDHPYLCAFPTCSGGSSDPSARRPRARLNAWKRRVGARRRDIAVSFLLRGFTLSRQVSRSNRFLRLQIVA